MGAAFFYQLTEDPLEVTLPVLLGKGLGAGWRIELRGTDPEAMTRLDLALWEHPKDSFLPHGLAGGAHDADQPILLTHSGMAAADCTCVVAVHGAAVSVEEVNAMARVMVLFDPGRADELPKARQLWKHLVDGGCSAQYWAQDGGGWTKKSESGSQQT